MDFRLQHNGMQRAILRQLVKRDPRWKAWAFAKGIVSREMTNAELFLAADEFNLRLDFLVALKRAKLLPIFDRETQQWLPVEAPEVPPVRPMDEQAMLDLIAEQAKEIASLKKVIRQLQVATGLEWGDPDEQGDVSDQRSHVRVLNENFMAQMP